MYYLNFKICYVGVKYLLVMKLPKKLMESWNSIFIKHPWIEAAFLSIFVHLVIFSIIWGLSELYFMFFPITDNVEKVIEIEFVT